jgi:hypothetical protein
MPIPVPPIFLLKLALPLCGWVCANLTRRCRTALPDCIMGERVVFLPARRWPFSCALHKWLRRTRIVMRSGSVMIVHHGCRVEA